MKGDFFTGKNLGIIFLVALLIGGIGFFIFGDSDAVQNSPGYNDVKSASLIGSASVITLNTPVTPFIRANLETQGINIYGATGEENQYYGDGRDNSNEYIESIKILEINDKFEIPLNIMDANKVLSEEISGEINCQLDIEFMYRDDDNKENLLLLGLMSVEEWPTNIIGSSFYSVMVPRCDTQKLKQKLVEIATIPNVVKVSPALMVAPTMDDIKILTNSEGINDGTEIPPAITTYDGSGEYVGLWDFDRAILDHPDLEGRLIWGDDDSIYDKILAGYAFPGHSTMIAGLYAGDGNYSSGLYVGAAPLANIVSYNVLYANFEVLRAVLPFNSIEMTYGILSASNSWTYLGKNNQLGNFGERENNYKWNIVGLWADKTPVVFSAGNNVFQNIFTDRHCNKHEILPDSYSDLNFFCLYNPSDAKNVLTVGATNKSKVLSFLSSRGPTWDGRIKPDVVAPGEDITTTTSPTLGSSSWYASNLFGTSFATPTVAGLIALLQQHIKEMEATMDEPFVHLSSLIHTLVIHTADDIGIPGPDFQSGHGFIDILGAMEVVNNPQNIIQDDYNDYNFEERKCYPVIMPNGPQEDLIVTLGYHDVVPEGRPRHWQTGLPTWDPDNLYELQNDIDLTIRDASEIDIFGLPFTLDPHDPLKPATTGNNDKDNFEKAIVSANYLKEFVVPGSHFNVCVEFDRVADANQDFNVIVGVGEYVSSCGNGVLESFEECDSSASTNLGSTFGGLTCGDFDSNPLILPQDPVGFLTCNNCKIDETTCYEPRCGNGVLDSGEICDPSAPAGGGNLIGCYPLEAGPIRACKPMCGGSGDLDLSQRETGVSLIFVQNSQVCIESPFSEAEVGPGGGPGGPGGPPKCDQTVIPEPDGFGMRVVCGMYDSGGNLVQNAPCTKNVGGVLIPGTCEMTNIGSGPFAGLAADCRCKTTP